MKCPTCKGEGSIEKNIPGNEGVPEQDIMIQCPECGGSGLICDECGESLSECDCIE